MFVSASQPGRLILGLILLCASATAPKAEVDHAAIARAALTEVIRPGYSALAGTTGVLEGKVAALCTRPSVDALEQAKAAFTDTVNAWSKVEILRLAPSPKTIAMSVYFIGRIPKGLACDKCKRL